MSSQATHYRIVRRHPTARGNFLHVTQRPVMVAVLCDEARFLRSGGVIEHGGALFIEDEMHDWAWSDGRLRYHGSARDDEHCDLLLIFETNPSPINFDPMTGQPIGVRCLGQQDSINERI